MSAAGIFRPTSGRGLNFRATRRTRDKTAAARELLACIDGWCLTTGTPEQKIGAVLFRHPGFVALLRKRLVVTPRSEAKVRAFMAQHPDGAKDVPAPLAFDRPPVGAPKAQARLLAAVDGPCCAKCGRTGKGPCSYPTCPRRGG